MNETSRYSVVSVTDLAPGCGSLMPIIYGVVVPTLAIFVLSVDSVIITVFMRPHVRSHTTIILTLIAIADVLNILPPTVVYVFYYTLGNYFSAIPYSFCQWTYILADVCHDLFNAISLWLTVLLAYIRCRCLKAPFEARCLHRCKNIALFVSGIVLIELLIHVPSVFLLNYHPVPRVDQSNTTVIDCAISDIDVLSTRRKVHLWSEVVIDSLIPTSILLYLDISILVTLRRAKQSRSSLRSLRSFKGPRSKAQSSGLDDVANSQNKAQNDQQNECNQSEINENDKHVGQNGKNCDNNCVHVEEQNYSHHSKQSTDKENSPDLFCCLDFKLLRQEKRETHIRFKKRHKCCCVTILGKRKRQFYLPSQPSLDSAFDKLDRESRRTSWLILAVATLITTHEIPSAFLHVQALTKHSDTDLPMSFFGCWSALLNLWQYVIYPVIFLIYAWMSSVFRQELFKVVRCMYCYDGDTEEPVKKTVFMSPCSVRKTLSREETTMHNSDSDSDIAV